MEIKLERLCQRLNYQFKHLPLLKQALTHCSVGPENYERLEFLGDSILSFVIANALFHQFPAESEGQLSRLRSYLVNGEMLADIALELDLGSCLYLGQGELKSGGFRRASILADALEAIFAAIYLDSDLFHCQSIILKLYESRLNSKQLCDNLKDPKTQLQEYLQALKLPLPEYQLIEIKGEEHDQIFHVQCQTTHHQLQTKGSAPNRRKAEQNAAKAMLKKLRSKKS